MRTTKAPAGSRTRSRAMPMRCSAACPPTSTVASRSACSGRSPDLDRRGRAIRRPLPLGEIAGDRGCPSGQRDRRGRGVSRTRMLLPDAAGRRAARGSDADRHLAREPAARLGPDDGTGDGWLVQEDRDGKVYRSLVDAAETFEKDPSAVLPRSLTRQREIWWKKKQPNAAWAERYGDQFELVDQLLRQSARRQRIVRWVASSADPGHRRCRHVWLARSRDRRSREAQADAALRWTTARGGNPPRRRLRADRRSSRCGRNSIPCDPNCNSAACSREPRSSSSRWR